MNPEFLPAFPAFKEKFESGKAQLVWRWISADLETPVSAYLKLCGETDHSFLLESVEGRATLGRYSVIGYDPDTVWACGDGKSKTGKQAMESLKELLHESRIESPDPDLPPMAVSGLFGYIGYDMVRLYEDIPDSNPDELGIPDSILIRPTMLAIFDNVKNMICLVTPVYGHAESSDKKAGAVYEEACAKIQNALEKLGAPLPEHLIRHESGLKTPLPVTSNMTEERFKDIVKKSVEYIHAGEIFQVVPSQRFSVDFDLPPFELYRALRRLNPSPFMFHLNFGEFSVVGSSPEILVRVRDGTVTIRPIAGTRKRGENPAEDRRLAEELLADPKERAEHLMLLDLGRNDVGRVSETGSVKVTDKFIIEKYSHVMHIVSNVEGRLKQGYDIIDALFAGFPAGTVSGAPKVRAMQIIDELEPTRRGIYAGGIGYFSGHGEMDSCIALRTAIVLDGKMYIQAGAGIVADSDPQSEYTETCNKAKALIRAAEMAIESAPPAPPQRQKAAS